jgi:hypothetical protein
LKSNPDEEARLVCSVVFGEVSELQFKNILVEAPTVEVVSIAPIVASAVHPLNIASKFVPMSVFKFPSDVRPVFPAKDDPKFKHAPILVGAKLVKAQFKNALFRSVTPDKSTAGNAVKPVQPSHVDSQSLLKTSIAGNVVNPVQPFQQFRKNKALVKVSDGKLVNPVQPDQVAVKFVPVDASIAGKLVSPSHRNQAD